MILDFLLGSDKYFSKPFKESNMSLRDQGLYNPLTERMAKSEASGLISVFTQRRMDIEKNEKKSLYAQNIRITEEIS